ncbi:bifunctional metallophosphatase/5'-nucleotidase [Kordiimonas aquimaris]|uniref:bifunctional metallophosphatase/5'-nucleotidase n=1 Tax=Kordiimonas aquimaris TaxID=707591 RepID=UPI0021D03257|nr:5'-nucleotidase C-terminal domain-containing protein [Kordiimonas aquimaris]
MKVATGFFAVIFGSLLSVFQVVADDTSAKTRLLYFSSFPEIRQAADAPGLAELASAIKAKSQEVPESYFIDGGASLGPSVLGSMDAGAHMVDLLNALEPAFMAIGKKEFSYGFDHFVVNAHAATFPIVTSNLIDVQTDKPIAIADSDFIIDAEQMTIGFIVLTSASAVTEYGARQIRALETKQVVTTKSAQLREEGSNAIILLADTDFDDLSYLQEEALVDVIFYAHNFDNPYSVDNQGQKHSDGALDNNLIVLDLWQEVGPNGTSILKTDVSFTDISTYSPEPAVDAQVKSYQTRLDHLLGSTLATLKHGFNTYRDNVRSSENPFANIVTDAMQDATGADAAIINGGSIRGNTNYHTGQQVNRGDIQRELPFENRVVLLSLEGSIIKEIIEQGIDCGLRLDGCFIHFSDIRVVYDANLPADNRITSIEMNGEKLNDNRFYRVAVSDFMARGNDGFTKLENAERITEKGTNRFIWRIVADYAAEMKILGMRTDGRLKNTAVEGLTPN